MDDKIPSVNTMKITYHGGHSKKVIALVNRTFDIVNFRAATISLRAE